MTENEKLQIAGELKVRLRNQSQNSLAVKCGISAATLSQMVNNNWSLIAEKMWRRVMIALKINFDWKLAETKNFKMLSALLDGAKKSSISIAIAHEAGAGKTETYKNYERSVDNVFYIECKTFWTRKNYMKAMLQTCGILYETGSIDEMVERFTDHLEGLDRPLVIIDQLDKLNDSSLDLFMDFYNDLNGYCGFVISGVQALKKRIDRGCQRDKSGYKEFYSRVGKRFVKLDHITLDDVTKICNANGLDDGDKINEIFNTCDNDLRRVKREVEKYFMTRKATA